MSLNDSEKWRLVAPLFILMIAVPTPAEALDFVAKVGAVSSSVENLTNTDLKISVVGFAPSMGMCYNVTQRLATEVMVQPLISFATREILRTGFYGGASYALLGGTRQRATSSTMVDIYYQSGWAVNAVSRVASQRYQMRVTKIVEGKETTIGNVEGSTLDVWTGASIRFDFASRHAFGLEVATTVASFANSSQRLRATESELALYCVYGL